MKKPKMPTKKRKVWSKSSHGTLPQQQNGRTVASQNSMDKFNDPEMQHSSSRLK